MLSIVSEESLKGSCSGSCSSVRLTNTEVYGVDNEGDSRHEKPRYIGPFRSLSLSVSLSITTSFRTENPRVDGSIPPLPTFHPIPAIRNTAVGIRVSETTSSTAPSAMASCGMHQPPAHNILELQGDDHLRNRRSNAACMLLKIVERRNNARTSRISFRLLL